MKPPREYASDVYTAVHKVQGQGSEYVELWHQAIAGVFAIAQAEAFKAGQQSMRERANTSVLIFRDGLTAHDERLALHMAAERITSLIIKDPVS